MHAYVMHTLNRYVVYIMIAKVDRRVNVNSLKFAFVLVCKATSDSTLALFSLKIHKRKKKEYHECVTDSCIIYLLREVNLELGPIIDDDPWIVLKGADGEVRSDFFSFL